MQAECIQGKWLLFSGKALRRWSLTSKQEGAEGVIELKATSEENGDDADIDADDPEVVKLMVDFLYTGDYEATSAIMHAKLYAIGSSYGIEDLQETAAMKYEEVMKYEWNSADFARAIRIVYTTTPEEHRSLRDITADTILKHKDVLLAKEDIEAAVIGIDKLAYALLKGIRAMKSNPGPMCGICGVAHVKQCLGPSGSFGGWAHCGCMIVACDCEGFSQCESCRSSE